MGAKENVVQKACLDYLLRKGYFVWRSNNLPVYDRKRKCYRKHNGRKGVPDIIGWDKNGRFIGIECKSAKGKPTEEQLEFGDALVRGGGCYAMVHSLSELIGLGF